MLDYVNTGAPGYGATNFFLGEITNRDPVDDTVQLVISWNRWTGDLQGNGILEYLPGGGFGNGFGINDAGDMVGWSSDVDDPNATKFWSFYRAARYTDSGGMESLGALLTNPKRNDFNGAFAWDINNFGEIVGWAGVGASSSLFLHRDDPEGMLDIGAATGLSHVAGDVPGYSEARVWISDTGYIAGNAVEGAFVLTPVAP